MIFIFELTRLERVLPMKTAFRYLTIVAFVACLPIALNPRVASAQSGSAGGSIGNDDKSVSGSRSAPRSVEEPDRPARRGRQDSDESPRASRKSGSGGSGGGGSFDGAWAIVIVGGPMCQGSITSAFTVSSGRIIGDGVSSGSVTPNGAAYASGTTKEGLTYTSSGRLSGRSSSGTVRRSDGCTGRWSATKQ
jgi:hypothetical protein